MKTTNLQHQIKYLVGRNGFTHAIDDHSLLTIRNKGAVLFVGRLKEGKAWLEGFEYAKALLAPEKEVL